MNTSLVGNYRIPVSYKVNGFGNMLYKVAFYLQSGQGYIISHESDNTTTIQKITNDSMESITPFVPMSEKVFFEKLDKMWLYITHHSSELRNDEDMVKLLEL